MSGLIAFIGKINAAPRLGLSNLRKGKISGHPTRLGTPYRIITMYNEGALNIEGWDSRRLFLFGLPRTPRGILGGPKHGEKWLLHLENAVNHDSSSGMHYSTGRAGVRIYSSSKRSCVAK